MGRLTEGSGKITLRVPKRFLQMIDFLVEVDDFPNRSEAIRTAIRDIVYERVQTVQDRLKKMEEAEKALANFEELKRRFMQS
ncbi:MAG TPA: ribbon-helix-helix domain-containing protein [Thermoplasmata archaeon]|nr:ribbon-helix-helix domain-containing protein [Thermoplasmata archaeon]